jgi:hypothetical protein
MAIFISMLITFFLALPLSITGIGMFLFIPGALFLWLVFLIWSLNSNTRARDAKLARLMAQAMQAERS